jgi:putative tryptophan/tyrosine transport system substrate-binding protein
MKRRAVGVRLIRANASNPAEVERAFVALVRNGAQGLIVSGQFVFFASLGQLGGLSISYKIPAVYATRHYVQAGGLASFGTYVSDGLYQMGVYAARILKGAKPSELPVQQITRTELFINLIAARALSITVPQTLLARADAVIE